MVLHSNLPDLTVRTMGELEEQGQAFALVFNLPSKQTLQASEMKKLTQTYQKPINASRSIHQSIR